MRDEQHLVDRARERLNAGEGLDSVLASLRNDDGLSAIECVAVLCDVLDVGIGRARAVVRLSSALADEKDADRESLVGALHEVNEVVRLRAGDADTIGEPAEQLGDLRAALVVALGMVAVERGPTGRTALVVPTDREILEEVGALRRRSSV
ncbi:hypothetical protein ACIBTV_05120 [Micromonospora sp. NPDC049366]|uniref:hypothetical protein n=1 Tax=Micromonospora sp. NPDC049366 TaxID=3364271 RepID=UPI00379853BB